MPVKHPTTDETGSSAANIESVAFAAIQGLNRKLEAQARESESRIQSLELRLSGLERFIAFYRKEE